MPARNPDKAILYDELNNKTAQNGALQREEHQFPQPEGEFCLGEAWVKMSWFKVDSQIHFSVT